MKCILLLKPRNNFNDKNSLIEETSKPSCCTPLVHNRSNPNREELPRLSKRCQISRLSLCCPSPAPQPRPWQRSAQPASRSAAASPWVSGAASAHLVCPGLRMTRNTSSWSSSAPQALTPCSGESALLLDVVRIPRAAALSVCWESCAALERTMKIACCCGSSFAKAPEIVALAARGMSRRVWPCSAAEGQSRICFRSFPAPLLPLLALTSFHAPEQEKAF